MFHQFYDNNLHSFLLGKIESYNVKSFNDTFHILILNLDGKEKILEYSVYENLVSDVQTLHEALNDYYIMVMENENSKNNVVGYDTCGDGRGVEYFEEDEDAEYEEGKKKRPMGFRSSMVKC